MGRCRKLDKIQADYGVVEQIEDGILDWNDYSSIRQEEYELQLMLISDGNVAVSHRWETMSVWDFYTKLNALFDMYKKKEENLKNLTNGR